MAMSVFLARLMGPVFLAVGIAVLVNAATFRKLADEFLNSPALIYLSGLLIMPVGLAIVLNHNVWIADWRVVITLLGWLAVIGGAFRIVCPQTSVSMKRAVLRKPIALMAGGIVWLAIGALLCFFGYAR